MFKCVTTLLIVAGVCLIAGTNGFFLSKTEKCQVAVFKGGKDFSGEKIMANKSFVPYLKSVGQVAKACKVKVHVIDSYKQLKTPKDFVLSSEMPMALGTGIRFDLQNQKGGTVCNKLCMVSRSWKTLPDANCFVNGLKTKGIKFTEPNMIDDGSVGKLTSTQLDQLKVHTQELCAPKTKTSKG